MTRRIGIALADVSGKGVAAALIMSVVQASLRIISSEGDVPLPRLVALMNQVRLPVNAREQVRHLLLCAARRAGAGSCATSTPGTTRRISCAPAGNRPPDSAPPEIEELSVGGTVVGMFPEMEYEEATVELFPGDVLLVFTDGVPEAHNPENEEFGEERLQRCSGRPRTCPADEISARISAEMNNWIRDAEQYDDLTFIVMKVR